MSLNSPCRFLFAIVVGCLAADSLQAQTQTTYFGGNYRPATAGESYARGMSDMIRAQGENNLNNSMAAGYYQDAYSSYLDNRVKSVDTYWQRREMYDQKMAEEAYVRQQKREKYFAKTLLKPLDEKQFNPSTGGIGWPILCREEDFADYRATLDQAFSKLATSGIVSMQEYSEASKAIKDFRAAITEKKDDYPKEAVSQALRFLISLNRELESQLG